MTDIFKKHMDTVLIMGAILSSFLWMQNKFSSLEKDITIIKTVLITKNFIQPEVFARQENNKEIK
jgi:hypothetical protein